MPYILNKTNGTEITTVQDASLDLTTDLVFLGRNYAGYGETQNENFLKLLENFANTSAPPRPIEGQLWYDTVKKQLTVYRDPEWKNLANLEVDTAAPTTRTGKTPDVGDLWYNSTEQQLHAYNGSGYTLIGPPTGADTRAGWRGSFEYSIESGPGTSKYNIKAVVGPNDEVVALVSNETYTILEGSDSFPLYPATTNVYKGIQLIGTDASGSSEAAESYFWGSASHALKANTATNAENVVFEVNTTTNDVFYPYFGDQLTGDVGSLKVSSFFTYNPYTKTLTTDFFNGTASSAYYADLAERYAADAVYDAGTVVVIGGEKEITLTQVRADTAVAGVVSKNPAYLMNSGAGSDETHPPVALKGRVPCKVFGKIKRGDLLVTSIHRGHAEAKIPGDSDSAVIGKALQDHVGLFGIIEIKV